MNNIDKNICLLSTYKRSLIKYIESVEVYMVFL